MVPNINSSNYMKQKPNLHRVLPQNQSTQQQITQTSSPNEVVSSPSNLSPNCLMFCVSLHCLLHHYKPMQFKLINPQ